MWQVKLSGGVSIESQGSGFINSKLEMGRVGPSLVFVILVSLGSIWRWGLTILIHGHLSFFDWAQESCGPSLCWDWFYRLSDID